ncbi:MAG: 50S ribosomal protein L34e [Methanobacterium sp.]|nr:50S ribosomal protein L34e [Methanobacterium sp.]
MPALRYRSRTYKRRFRRTPGGETVLHYKKKKPKKHHCAECGKLLHGVPRGRPYQIRKLAKSKKRPNRPFGGNLCTECTRRFYKEQARSLLESPETITTEDIEESQETITQEDIEE